MPATTELVLVESAPAPTTSADLRATLNYSAGPEPDFTVLLDTGLQLLLDGIAARLPSNLCP
ncbi:hypothetical protein [Nocardia sp. NPDC005998]|uniref:hypothetical protein n=1 Tax=Nocardia sp. NPDC005998 TaxID=3156894 RepID=UPI0033A1B5E3